MAFDFTSPSTPKGDYYKEVDGIGDNTETTLVDDCGIVGRCRGVVGYAESDKTGELKIYFINRSNTAVLDQTVTVTAGQLTVFDFDRLLLRYKITFTRTDSPYTGDATASVEVMHYGASK
tara:strand:+ start:1085 stop:1444 length:360 start_codon:yes stop_codon:yes gene_type:complete